ncbi:MAG: Glu/Leu/Phe/Val dehydrogenase dimerization domain-containing protein [Planctomycetota bacterium]|nr:Glu/Leu/Phe/Val dehydrogenase dimerization domain-containing protein [Planctomycetota bacterium]
MGNHILEAMAREGFEEVTAIHDRDSNLRGFLGLHDTSVGPAIGGIRRWSYLDEDRALRDCLRLSRAMSHKCAIAGLQAGGGKLVVIDRPDLEVEAAYRAIGSFVERLRGRFYTGPDVGTSAKELACVAEKTRYVTDPGPDGPGELAEATAEGVFRSMEAALRHLDGDVDWKKRSVVVQGLGEVGRGLARRLVEQGARVRAAEIDPDRALQVHEELEIELIDPSSEFDVACDILAPCALGGILHDLTLTRLRCRIVAGAANNVLARAAHADRLHEMGIFYAPDFVINAGALIRGALFHLEGRLEPVAAIGTRIEKTALGLFERARERNLVPARLAVIEAEDEIERRRSGGGPTISSLARLEKRT